MKIRNGYVSNSSSSSFCVLGITQSALLRKNPKMAEAFENDETDMEEYLGINWRTDEIEVVSGLDEYYDDRVVGLPAKAMKDDETLLDFKKRVVEFFKNKGLNVDVEDIDWRIDGGHD